MKLLGFLNDCMGRFSFYENVSIMIQNALVSLTLHLQNHATSYMASKDISAAFGFNYTADEITESPTRRFFTNSLANSMIADAAGRISRPPTFMYEAFWQFFPAAVMYVEVNDPNPYGNLNWQLFYQNLRFPAGRPIRIAYRTQSFAAQYEVMRSTPPNVEVSVKLIDAYNITNKTINSTNLSNWVLRDGAYYMNPGDFIDRQTLSVNFMSSSQLVVRRLDADDFKPGNVAYSDARFMEFAGTNWSQYQEALTHIDTHPHLRSSDKLSKLTAYSGQQVYYMLQNMWPVMPDDIYTNNEPITPVVETTIGLWQFTGPVGSSVSDADTGELLAHAVNRRRMLAIINITTQRRLQFTGNVLARRLTRTQDLGVAIQCVSF